MHELIQIGKNSKKKNIIASPAYQGHSIINRFFFYKQKLNEQLHLCESIYMK